MVRLNFADVDDQKEFGLLPDGLYTAEILGLEEKLTSSEARNPGARMLRWSFKIVNNSNESYNDRRVWDSQVCVPDAMWKIKALCGAVGIDPNAISYDDEDQQFYLTDSDGDENVLDMDDLLGEIVDMRVGKREASKGKNGQDYKAQNKVVGFYLHEASDEDMLA